MSGIGKVGGAGGAPDPAKLGALKGGPGFVAPRAGAGQTAGAPLPKASDAAKGALSALRGGGAGGKTGLGSIQAELERNAAELQTQQRQNDAELFDAVRQDPGQANAFADKALQEIDEKQASGAPLDASDFMRSRSAWRVKENVLIAQKVAADPAGCAERAGRLLA